MKRIRIDISPNGEVKREFDGFQNDKCSEEEERIKNFLEFTGVKTNVKYTEITDVKTKQIQKTSEKKRIKN